MRKTLAASAGLTIAALWLGIAAAQDISATRSPQEALDPKIMRIQVILDRLGFSPGVIDGRHGKSFVAAVKGFQTARGMTASGDLDKPTLAAFDRYRDFRAVRALALTEDGLAGPFTNPMPKDPQKQAKLDGLHYRNRMEKLAEMFHTKPSVLIEMNSLQTLLRPGTRVNFPNVLPSSRTYDATLSDGWRQTLSMLNVDPSQPRGARIVVDKSDEVLRVYNDQDRLVAQFPATMGSEHDPLPIGKWKINGFDYNPEFSYNPDLFWDAKRGAEKALLPPGPNGPVGVIWIDLSKPHYGIHGTPEPSTIGRAESHGCIRLTNWDAARLSLMVRPGTPAVFQE